MTHREDKGRLHDATEAYSAYLRRREQDKDLDLSRFCEENPDLADDLERLHEGFRLGQSLATSRSFLHSVREHLGSDVDEITLSLGSSSPSDPDWRRDARSTANDSDRYSVEDEVARGGMGVIYRVRDRDLSRTIAMKVMLGAPGDSSETTGESAAQTLTRFLEEAQVTAQLDHPGIVPVYELGFDPEGRVFFTMKLVKGRELGEIFELARTEREGWNLPRVIGVLVKVCQAVAFAHAKSVVHRDLKPSNIMVGRFGEVYVMDWGLAKVTGKKDLHDIRLRPDAQMTFTTIQSDRRRSGESSAESPLITMDGAVVGTPAYMPPEQAKGRVDEVDQASDVYSLGAILYNLLTAHPPYVESGDRVSPRTILAAVMQGPPRPVHQQNRDAPPELVAICEKAMSRDREDRYSSCLDMAEDLQASLDHRVVRAYRSGAVAELKAWVKRNRTTAAVAAGASCVLLLGLLGFLVHLELSRTRLDATAKDLRRRLYSSQLFQVDTALTSGHLSRASALLDECPRELRHWEWEHLRLQFEVRNGQTLRGHTDRVRAVTVSSDGKLIVSASDDGTLKVWNAATGEAVHTFEGHEGPVASVTAALRANLIASGGDDGTVRLWSLSGEFRELRRIDHGTFVHSVAFDPSAERVASGGEDALVKVWDANTGNLVGTLRGHGGPVSGVAFTAGGERIVSSSSDTTVRVWDARSYEEIEVLQRHAYPVSALATKSAGEQDWIAAASSGQAIHGSVRMSLPNDLTDRTFRPDDRVKSLAFSPDGRWIAVAASGWRNRTITVYDTATAERLTALEGQGGSGVAFLPDGGRLVSASDDGTVRIWPMASWKPRELRGHTGPLRAVEFSPDGRRIASASLDGTLKIWNVRTGEEALSITHDDWVLALAYSPEGELIVSGDQGGHLNLWDARTGKPHQTLTSEAEAAIWWVDFSPDGSRIVAGRLDGTVRLWDAKTGEDLGLIGEHKGWINGLAFSPDGSRVALLSRGGVKLWDLEERRELWQAKPGERADRCVAFNSSGTQLAAGGDGTVWIYDAATGETLLELSGHNREVNCVAFSSDEARIFSAGHDATIKVWASTGEELLTLSCPEGGVCWHVAVSPDGKTIASSHDDGTVRIWESTRATRQTPTTGATIPVDGGLPDATPR